MTRVPPPRLPTARPAAAPARAAQPKKPKAQEKLDKPQKAKAGQAEEGGESTQAPETQSGPEAGKDHKDAHEASQHETLWAPDSHAEAAEKKDTKEAVQAEKEREEEAKDGVKPGAPKAKDGGAKSKGAGPNAAKRQSDGFERTKEAGKGGLAAAQEAKATTGANPVLQRAPINAVQSTRPALAPPPSNRPPDAFQLLHQAQDKGVYFKEDGLGSGPEAEDPELAAAVEEAIRLLFGVRGILRVGPGKNMDNEPVVVVVATQGFGEAALKTVPQLVHRFPTLLAIPFDLLPLKKER